MSTSERSGAGRWLAVAMVVMLVVLDLGAGWAALTRYRDERADAIQALADDAGERAAIVDQLVLAGFDQLDAVASSAQLRSGDPEQILTALRNWDAPAAGFTAGIGWTDRGGDLRVLTGSGPGLVRVPLSDRDFVVAGLQGDRFVGRAVISRVLRRPVVTVAVPTRDASGTVNGVLSASVLLERTGRLLGALTAGSDVLMADRAGQLIVDDRPTLEQVRQPSEEWPASRLERAGTAVGVTDPTGRPDRVVAWAWVPSAGWAAIVSRPESRVLGQPRQNLVVGLGVIAVISALLAALAVLSLRRLDRRYRVLRGAAEEADDERRRSAAVAEAMAQLAAADTALEVARVVSESGGDLFGARVTGMSVRDPDQPEMLVSLSSEGWPDDDRQTWRRYRIDAAIPAGEAVLSGRPVFVTASDLPHRYPAATRAMAASGDRAWAAVPLMDGRRCLGVLAVGFRSSSALGDRNRLRLTLFAERVSNALSRVARSEAEHQLALAFQRAVIPTHLPAIRGVQVEGHYLPASQAIGVGGDWYDAIRVDDHSLMVMCGDIVGHGLAAASAASRVRVAAATLAPTHRPAALLERLDVLVDRDPDARYSSMVCLLVDAERQLIEYSVAGHPAPLVVRSLGTPYELVHGRGHLLGVTRAARPTGWSSWNDRTRSVLLYTDGLIERRGEAYDTGVHRLVAACAATRVKARTAEQLVESMVHDSRIDDDLTAVLIHLDATSLREETDQPRQPARRGR